MRAWTGQLPECAPETRLPDIRRVEDEYPVLRYVFFCVVSYAVIIKAKFVQGDISKTQNTAFENQ